MNRRAGLARLAPAALGLALLLIFAALVSRSPGSVTPAGPTGIPAPSATAVVTEAPVVWWWRVGSNAPVPLIGGFVAVPGAGGFGFYGSQPSLFRLVAWSKAVRP